MFTYEAVEQLNIKGKNWKDLLDDTPFTKNDIIVLQEPNKLAKFNIASFHHVKNSLKVETEGNTSKTIKFENHYFCFSLMLTLLCSFDYINIYILYNVYILVYEHSAIVQIAHVFLWSNAFVISRGNRPTSSGLSIWF